MSEFNIEVKGGSSVRLPTAGKYCDRDIVVTAADNSEELKGFIERSLTTVNIPDSVTSIGRNAFSDCTNLKLTSLPSGVTSIKDGAFDYCAELALTSLPSGVTVIGSSAFRCCTNLELTSIPSGVTSIGAYAFAKCTKLTKLTFKGTPQSIIVSAFSSCTNLRTINVPWSYGAVANAPWGATNATINYNYKGD